MTKVRIWRPLVTLAVLLVILVSTMAGTKTWQPKLGLDLRGGTTVTLTARNTVGAAGVDATSLQQAQSIIESRVNSLGVGESEVTTSGSNQIIVAVPNVQRDKLVELVGQTANLRFRAVYAAAPLEPTVSDPSAAPNPSAAPTQPSVAPSGASASESPSAVNPTKAVPSATPVKPTAAKTPAQRGGGGQVPQDRPQVPTAPPTPIPTTPGAGTPPGQALGWTPTEEQLSAFKTFTCADPQVDVADQPLLSCERDGSAKYLLGPTLIEGSALTSANAGIPQGGLAWTVNLQFNAEGSSAFEKATGELSAKQEPENRFAIVLDGQTISAPAPSSAIPGGSAEITGGFTQTSATDLANVLKYGALPLAFDISEVNNVSATLGGEQLHAGIVAGLIGLGLVVLFCFAYYRGLGIVVVASLGIAGVITYASMVLLGSSVGFALNLPGIAGAIVAIGVTADSFVIYFERIRDEVRDGRSLRTAVESGWKRARQTILIADAVSMLSALVLFVLAVGSIKGFAFTLGLTTMIDVLIVFLFTKPLMSLLARTKFFGGGHKLSGLDPNHLGVERLPGTRTRVGTKTTPTTTKEAS